MGIDTDAILSRLDLLGLLESSVKPNTHAAAAFQRVGGVKALHPWMEVAMPSDGAFATAYCAEAQQRREHVMHACVLVLRHIPVEVSDLRESRLGFLLQDLKGACEIGREDVQALLGRWKEAFRIQKEAPVGDDEKEHLSSGLFLSSYAPRQHIGLE